MTKTAWARTPLAAKTAAIAGAAALALAGCSSAGTTASGGTAGSSGHGYTVDFIPLLAGVGFYNTMAAGGEAEAKKLGITFNYDAPTSYGVQQQNAVLSAACGKHVSAVMIAPINPDASRAAISQCIAEGVAVSTIDTALKDTSQLVSTITSDNTAGGAQAADYLCKKIGDQGTVAQVATGQPLTTLTLRMQGFTAEMGKVCPQVKVKQPEYPSSASVTQSNIQAELGADPSIKAVFTPVEPAATPLAHGIAAAGKTGQVLLVGYDAGQDEVSLLKQGSMSAIIAQQPALEAKDTLDALNQALASGSAKPASSQSKLVDNVLITQDNVNDANMKDYFYLK